MRFKLMWHCDTGRKLFGVRELAPALVVPEVPPRRKRRRAAALQIFCLCLWLDYKPVSTSVESHATMTSRLNMCHADPYHPASHVSLKRTNPIPTLALPLKGRE